MSETNEIKANAAVADRLDGVVMPRFRVEERSGIVAVYDTHHTDYQETPGCHPDYPWCVASWMGIYDTVAGHWSVDPWKIDRAHALAAALNGEA